MTAAVSQMTTGPGWLVQIGVAPAHTPSYVSTLGDVTAMGIPFAGASFRITGLDESGNLLGRGSIEFDDPDLSWTALHLLGSLADARVLIWRADRGALAAGDPVPAPRVSLGRSRAQPMRGTVTWDLVPASPGAPKTPRLRIGPQTGVNRSLPPGAVLQFGAVTFTVKDPRA